MMSVEVEAYDSAILVRILNRFSHRVLTTTRGIAQPVVLIKKFQTVWRGQSWSHKIGVCCSPDNQTSGESVVPLVHARIILSSPRPQHELPKKTKKIPIAFA